LDFDDEDEKKPKELNADFNFVTKLMYEVLGEIAVKGMVSS